MTITEAIRTSGRAEGSPVIRAVRRFDRLTAEEARRALYVDFEGEKDKAPVLLGTLRRRGLADAPQVHQVVIDPEFAQAGPSVRGLRESIETVVMRAEHRDCRIVAWSMHELKVVRRLCEDDLELIERFERRYVNALSVAKRWVNRLHREDRPTDGKLVDYLAFIDYEVPPDAGGGQVGDTIRALRPTLQGGRPLTANQKARWDRLLRHNRYDCDGMREVCLIAASELEAVG